MCRRQCFFKLDVKVHHARSPCRASLAAFLAPRDRHLESTTVSLSHAEEVVQRHRNGNVEDDVNPHEAVDPPPVAPVDIRPGKHCSVASWCCRAPGAICRNGLRCSMHVWPEGGSKTELSRVEHVTRRLCSSVATRPLIQDINSETRYTKIQKPGNALGVCRTPLKACTCARTRSFFRTIHRQS